MNILVINTGSSTIKYQLFDMSAETAVAAGMLERIGEEKARLEHRTGDRDPVVIEQRVSGHNEGMSLIVSVLTNSGNGAIRDISDIDGVGHRVVHGGEDFHKPVVIDDEVIKAITKNIPLAPLHNPANLAGIENARSAFSGVPHVAVFDTAFHQTIPRKAYRYCLPREMYEKFRIRRYGFHGTSHQFVAGEAAKIIGESEVNAGLITIHLGNGASVTAVKSGKSVDTSMGMTPLEGLCMGTRCGDIDPAIIFHLAENAGMTLDQINSALNRDSGLKGLCGENDMRNILERVTAGDADATLAVDVYTYRIRKYIGSYMAVLGGAGAVVFTGGIGVNAPEIRNRSCMGLEKLGIIIDQRKNNDPEKCAREISADDSPVKVLVIPTNEELAIARQTAETISVNI